MFLNNHTYYSLRYGAMSPEELLEEAQKNGLRELVLTDINNTSTCPNFVRLAPKYNIKPILGIDFRNGADQQFVGIAKNNEGFRELNQYLSDYLHNKKEKMDARAPEFENAFAVYPLEKWTGFALKPHEFIGISPYQLNLLRFGKRKFPEEKLVVLHTVSFRNKRDFNAHRLLRAIDNNILLSKLPKSEEGKEEHRWLDPATLMAYFADYPHILKNTQALLNQCSIHFEFGAEHPPKNKKTYTASEEEDYRLLKQLCYEGLEYRYPDCNDNILDRLQKELKIIREKDFVSYFLINWDIVNYARRKGYFYVGRGSGANSVVAYLLRITDVDPIELDLYFERFINLYRKSPPDFDIDFSWTDRDDVTRYIFDRFPHVVLLATYSTFQQRAVRNELGKVFGLPRAEIEKLSEGQPDINRLDHISGLVIKYSKLIQGFPSHLSVHAGGILISEKDIHYYTATSLPPKNFPITHFDMLVAEDLGLYKFDILSQRGLSKIKDCLSIVRQNHPYDEKIDIHDMKKFKKDEKVKDLLRNAKAMGCFYVESPAMRMLLKKLEVDNYLGLVAASSIIRPGVAKSGMMREYILRYRYPERRKEAHPIMMKIMPETYGVMVYQEDVIKVAHFFAGLSLSEADVLRRGMSGKFRSRTEFQKVKDMYFKNCREKGYNESLSREIWFQIESFAGYAFAKGHSASYAVESFQSLYLKAHYPLEFMVAVINNFGGFYRTEYYVHEARMAGANIQAPCINRSRFETVILGKSIYIGYMFLHELETQTAKKIVMERDKNGPFRSFDDFLERIAVSLEQISILIRINAFRFTGKNKRELLWQAHLKLGHKKEQPAEQKQLFHSASKEFTMPELSHSIFEDIFDQIELLGFSLHNPFLLLKNAPENQILAQDFELLLGQTIKIWGYLATIKYTRTSKKETMYFGTFLDQKGYFFDTVHFPPVAAQFPFRGKGIYAITGKVVEEFGFYSLEVTCMEKEAIIEDPRYNEKPLSLNKRLIDEFYKKPAVN